MVQLNCTAQCHLSNASVRRTNRDEMGNPAAVILDGIDRVYQLVFWLLHPQDVQYLVSSMRYHLQECWLILLKMGSHILSLQKAFWKCVVFFMGTSIICFSKILITVQ